MNIEYIKRFIYESCKFLKIKIEKIDNELFVLKIPKNLLNDFKEEEVKITFNKKTSQLNDCVYINKDSFFIKKLAKIVSKYNTGITKAKQKISLKQKLLFLEKKYKNIKVLSEKIEYEKHLLAWFKVIIRGHMVDEYILTYNYDFQKEQSKYLGFKNVSDIPYLRVSNDINVDIESILDAIDIIMYESQEQILKLIREKENEYAEILDKELKRVHEYYHLLEKELENKFALKEDYNIEDLDSLTEEKEYLIDQITYKYNVNLNNVSIKPIAFILIQQEIEEAEINIHNKSLNLNAKYTNIKSI